MFKVFYMYIYICIYQGMIMIFVFFGGTLKNPVFFSLGRCFYV